MSTPAPSLGEHLARLPRQRRRAAERALAKLQFRPGDTCPGCGAGRVFQLRILKGDVPLDFCGTCRTFWERETRADPDNVRCDNCAFRAGSPEQQDPERWKAIVEQTVKGYGVFYCHKRVPAMLTDDGIEFQHRVEGGQCVNAPVCIGWLDAQCKLAAKDEQAAPAENA